MRLASAMAVRTHMRNVTPALRRIARVGLVAAVYFVTARIGLGFAIAHPGVSLIWSPSGIALERSNRELQQFDYVAAHDLQEPLRTVAAYTDRGPAADRRAGGTRR